MASSGISGSWCLLQVCLVGATVLFPQTQAPRARAIKACSLKTLKKSETTEVTSPPSRGLSKPLKPEHLPVTFSKNPKAGMAPLSFCQSRLSQLTPEAGHN